MKKSRHSDCLRAVPINPKQCNFVLSQCKHVLSVQICVISAILSMCYHIWREKTLHGKNKYGSQGSANSGNVSLKFEVNSTLIFTVKCPSTKLEESQCNKLTFLSTNERTKALLNRQSCEEQMVHCKHVRCKYIAQNYFMHIINK